jgi:hypothetical protein
MEKKRNSHVQKLRFFPPWFVPMNVFRQIQAMLPRYYHDRLRLYFDRHGCMRCKRKDRLYFGSGFCRVCLPLVTDRLKQIDKEMKKIYAGERAEPAQRFLSGRAKARALLADLRGKV